MASPTDCIDVITAKGEKKSLTPKSTVEWNKENKRLKVAIKPSEVIKMVDTFDRPGDASANATYDRAGTYAEAFTN